jgi:hypothetical protein
LRWGIYFLLSQPHSWDGERREASGALNLTPLSLLPDGRALYKKRPMVSGREEPLLAPMEFLRKLATLIPPPRKHSFRFHGVFGTQLCVEKALIPSCPATEAAATVGTDAPLAKREARAPGPRAPHGPNSSSAFVSVRRG